MSDTTIINSRAIQTLLAGSQSRLDQTASSGASTVSSFHQLLEKTVSEDARASASPSSLATAALTSRISTAGAAERFSRAIAGATSASRTGASVQVPKPADAASGGVKGNAASRPSTAPNASAQGLEADGLPTSGAEDDSPSLDSAQTKIVNAPALPEPAQSVARSPAQSTPGRGQSEGSPKNASPAVSPEPTTAGTLSQTSGASSRGFIAALADARASAAVPTSLIDQASFDPSLQMSVTPQAAHLSLDTGASGGLSAQLQITNGVADVRLTGEAAAVLAKHGAELSLGLTAAGLQPGRLEITAPSSSADMQSATSDGSGSGGFQAEAGSRDDSNSQPEQQPTPPGAKSPSAPTLNGRVSRVHVKA